MITVLLVPFFATQIDGYLSGTTLTRVSTSFALVATVAVGQTLVVLTRNVDLSVGLDRGRRRVQRRHASSATLRDLPPSSSSPCPSRSARSWVRSTA